MTKWYAHVAHMAKHMNMVGDPWPGPLGTPKSGAASRLWWITQSTQRHRRGCNST